MPRFLFVLICVAFLNINSFSQQLSPSAEISLITASPGNELYSIFGHSAIRVRDDAVGVDWVYGYGTFDFDTPNFYLKFMRGKLNYSLSIANFDQFYYTYVVEKRSLYEQVLNLSASQKQKIFDALQENYLPENRYYKYDFFFDNCATRIGHIFKIAFGDSIIYGNEHVKKAQTFRDLIDLYLAKMPWSDYGIDVALGLPTDAVAESEEYMFLPDYVDSVFQSSKIITDGKVKDLVKSRKIILDIRNELQLNPTWFKPYKLNVIIFLFAVFISFLGYNRKRRYAAVDIVFFNIVGFLGWQIIFLWFFTDHIATKDNLNLLWAWPIFFPLFFFIFKENMKTLRKYVFVVFTIAGLITLIFWNVLPQNLHDALIWILSGLIVRSIYNLFFDLKLKTTTNYVIQRRK